MYPKLEKNWYKKKGEIFAILDTSQLVCARTGKILVKNWEIFVTVLGIKYVWTSRKVPMARPGRDSHCVSDSDCAL